MVHMTNGKKDAPWWAYVLFGPPIIILFIILSVIFLLILAKIFEFLTNLAR